MRKFLTSVGLHDEDLPECVRGALAGARAARPDGDVECISLRTLESGREIARIGLDAELIPDEGAPSVLSRFRPKHLLVLSVSVTETTFEAVRTVTHVLIARTTPGPTRIEPVSDLPCR